VYTTEELLANVPDFERVRILGGESPYRQPVIPGEQRLVPSMQEQLRPNLPPVRKAQMDLGDPNAFLSQYISELHSA
jgi:hypothetical protein